MPKWILQIKPVNVLIIKRDMENPLILDLQKEGVKFTKLFLKGDKEEKIRNHLLGHYLMGSKIKLFKRKQ